MQRGPRTGTAVALVAISALALSGCAALNRLDRALSAPPGQAAYERGLRLKQGNGGPRDDAKAVAQFREAARLGHADAQFRLGLARHTGRGATRDHRAALQWFRRAAAHGHVEAQFFIGLYYWRGLGVDKDARDAVRWFQRAASAGHAGALYQLGIAYAGGNGVKRDAARADSYFEMAAALGHPEAAYLAGMAATNGRGARKNHAWAARWYGKSAEAGLARSQYMLGVAYGAGLGLPKDKAQSYLWLTLAADRGEDAGVKRRAAQLRDAVKDLVPAGKRAEIERLAAAWRATPVDRISRFGDKPTVRFTQFVLDRAGHSPGPVDGLLGPKTRRAIRSYQKKRGIKADGRISAGLLRSLREENGERLH